MKTFKIEVKEILSRIIGVEANSIEDAFSIIKKQYHKEEIVLDSDDFVETEFLKSED